MTSKFNNVYVGDAITIASVYEKDGPIATYFDLVYDKISKVQQKKAIKILALIMVIAWIVFRIFRIWNSYSLMPYYNILFL